MSLVSWKDNLDKLLQKSAAGEAICQRDKLMFIRDIYGDGVIEGRKRQRQELKEKLVKGEINVSISVERL